MFQKPGMVHFCNILWRDMSKITSSRMMEKEKYGLIERSFAEQMDNDVTHSFKPIQDLFKAEKSNALQWPSYQQTQVQLSMHFTC